MDQKIEITIELTGMDALPFLDTLTIPTLNSIEYSLQKSTHTDRYLDYNSNHPISANLSVLHTLIHRDNRYALHLNFLLKKWITFTKHYKTTTTQHSSFNKATATENQQKTKPINRKIYRRNQNCHTIHQRPQQTIQHTLAKYIEFSLKAPTPSSLYLCIQKIQFQMFRKLA